MFSNNNKIHRSRIQSRGKGVDGSCLEWLGVERVTREALLGRSGGVGGCEGVEQRVPSLSSPLVSLESRCKNMKKRLNERQRVTKSIRGKVKKTPNFEKTRKKKNKEKSKFLD